jgi:hypothetical protein
MIQVYLDKSSIFQDESAIVVSDNLSYINAYKKVNETLQNNSSCQVVIRKNIYKIWLERYSERHPGKFVFREVSRRMLLENKWDIPIPQYVDDEDILNLGLIDIFEKPSKGTDFEDYILAKKYSSSLADRKFNLDTIIDLLNNFSKEFWSKNSHQKLLLKIYNDRLKLWMSGSNNDFKRILEKISNHIEAFRKELIAYHILKNYRSIIKKIIPDYQLYDSLKINTSRLKFIKEDYKDIEDQIIYEINSWDEPVDVNSMLAYLNGFSGLLNSEFEKVKSIIQLRPQLLSIKVLESVENKFQNILKEIKNDLFELHQSIPPTFPEEPQLDWTVDQMLSWCKKEYFPYFRWSINSSTLDENFDYLGKTFSVWFYNEYENIVSNHDQILYKFLPNNFEVFNSNKDINIVLIIDNLPWFFNKEIQDIFLEKKFSLSSIEPYLTMLPSITEVCKKTLLTGQDRYSKIEEKNYKQILEDKGWVPYFEDDKFRYYSNLGSFINEKNLKPGAYFINYLEIDELFHKSEEKIGVPHKKLFINHIQNIVEVLNSKIDKHGLADNVNIHVISDHGSTYLHPEIKSEIDNDYFKTGAFQAISPRYIKLSTSRLNNLPEHIEEKCFSIDEIKFGTPTNYLVPKKKDSFIKIRDHYWSHGGLLPEEVVVPHMTFKRANYIVERPDIILKDNSFRYALQKIEFDVGNPNDFEMTDVYIGFLNTNFETSEQTIKVPNIESKNKEFISIDGKFKKTVIKREQEKLSIEIRFSINSVQYNFDLDCPINLKSMVEAKGDDIFDQLDF